MKTNFNRTIQTIAEAKTYLKELFNNGESYHPDECAVFIEWNIGYEPHVYECIQMDALMEQVRNLSDEITFSCYGYFIALMRLRDGEGIYLASINAIFSAPEDEPIFDLDGILIDKLPASVFNGVTELERIEVWNRFKFDIYPSIDY